MKFLWLETQQQMDNLDVWPLSVENEEFLTGSFTSKDHGYSSSRLPEKRVCINQSALVNGFVNILVFSTN